MTTRPTRRIAAVAATVLDRAGLLLCVLADWIVDRFYLCPACRSGKTTHHLLLGIKSDMDYWVCDECDEGFLNSRQYASMEN